MGNSRDEEAMLTTEVYPLLLHRHFTKVLTAAGSALLLQAHKTLVVSTGACEHGTPRDGRRSRIFPVRSGFHRLCSASCGRGADVADPGKSVAWMKRFTTADSPSFLM